MTAPFPFHPVWGMRLEPPQEAPGGFWDVGRREGSGGRCPGAMQKQREAEDGARGALSTFHIWRNFGNNLPGTAGSITDGDISEQSGQGCSQLREHRGAGNHLSVPQSTPGDSRGEQKLPKTSLPCPAVPSLASPGADNENDTGQGRLQLRDIGRDLQ